MIENRLNAGCPSADEVKVKIKTICNEMKTEVFDHISNEIGASDRKGVADANKKARRIIDDAWSSYNGLISICPGKAIVSALSAWSQKKFGVSFSALAIAREIQLKELATEATQLVAAIENLSDFST